VIIYAVLLVTLIFPSWIDFVSVLHTFNRSLPLLVGDSVIDCVNVDILSHYTICSIPLDST